MELDKRIEYYRPWLNDQGESIVSIDGENRPSETKAIWTKQQWHDADRAALAGFRNSIPIVTELLAAGLKFEPKPDALVEPEPTPQEKETPTRLGRIVYQLETIPLPFIHHDFFYVKGEDIVIRSRIAGSVVGEWVEEVICGTAIPHGLPPQIRGIINHPKTRSHRTPERWLQAHDFHGPYLHLKIKEMDVTIQASTEWFRIIVALQPMIIQWKEHFKFITIMVPHIQENRDGYVGIAIQSKV